MKKLSLLIVSLLALNAFPLHAQEVQKQDALAVAQRFLELRSQGQDFTIRSVEGFIPDGHHLAWVINFDPKGFVVVSQTENIRPIMAYSFESPWLTGGKEEQIFLTLMELDFQTKLKYPVQSVAYRQKCKTEWAMYRNMATANTGFEQWPPEGTTPTGGWLFTNWTQNAPYNSMCPIDPQTHQRSYSGCPATAMSQILNCIITINNTRFDDGDDYWHNFGSGNQYWIDDDWEEHGFPCFDTLNTYLETLEENYLENKPPTENEIAALTFACGTALKQVYSSSISGTFGIEQARDAFQRFGFGQSRLTYSSDTMLNYDLAQNIIDGNPAQLGLIDPQHTVGHNVVVDGYNTNEFFHFNFGWGGNSNGWYTMPPSSAPYNLTVIEGIVIDIFGDNPHVSLTELPNQEKKIKIRFQQGNFLIVANQSSVAINPEIRVFDGLGRLLYKTSLSFAGKGEEHNIELPSLQRGVFLVHILYGQGASETFKFLKSN